MKLGQHFDPNELAKSAATCRPSAAAANDLSRRDHSTSVRKGIAWHRADWW